MRSTRAFLFTLLMAIVAMLSSCGGQTDGPKTDTSSVAQAPDEHVGQVSQALTTITWSGYTWNVKNGNGLGPGPNNWRDASDTVWIDGTGSLNLKVQKIAGVWYCAEVYLPSSLGYGTYEFFLKNRSDIINKNLVEGLFLYQDDTHELDIEWSKWGNGSNPNNGDFGVQPSDFRYWHQDIVAGNWHKERIIWSPTQVEFQVETNSVIVQDWVYTGPNNFVPGLEVTHINNWLFQGKPPSNNTSSTMTLVSFTYTP